MEVFFVDEPPHAASNEPVITIAPIVARERLNIAENLLDSRDR
jgi:hypothetical protein